MSDEKNEKITKAIFRIMDRYYQAKPPPPAHTCFLSAEERQIAKDLIQFGKYVKRGIIIGLATGTLSLIVAMVLLIGG